MCALVMSTVCYAYLCVVLFIVYCVLFYVYCGCFVPVRGETKNIIWQLKLCILRVVVGSRSVFVCVCIHLNILISQLK